MDKGLSAYVQQSIENDVDFEKSSLPEVDRHEAKLTHWDGYNTCEILPYCPREEH